VVVPKILLIVPDDAIREAMVRGLLLIEQTAVAVAQAEDALVRLDGFVPDVCVIDLDDVTGALLVLEAVRGLCGQPELPAVFLVGEGTHLPALSGEVVRKPFGLQDLATGIRQALATPDVDASRSS
jgi:DNA-binding NtrC family response regulator